jgi:4-amino-4-deoxy-L-arabinose transferase-like glycosyltransferase
MALRILAAWLATHRRASWWLGIACGCIAAACGFAYFTGYGDSSNIADLSVGLSGLCALVATAGFLTLADERPRDSYRW